MTEEFKNLNKDGVQKCQHIFEPPCINKKIIPHSLQSNPVCNTCFSHLSAVIYENACKSGDI